MKTKTFFIVTKEMNKRIKLNVLFESIFGFFFLLLFISVLIPIFFNDYGNITFVAVGSTTLSISFISTIILFIVTYANLKKLKELLTGSSYYSKKIKEFIEKRLKRIYIPLEGFILSGQIQNLVRKLNK